MPPIKVCARSHTLRQVMTLLKGFDPAAFKIRTPMLTKTKVEVKAQKEGAFARLLLALGERSVEFSRHTAALTVFLDAVISVSETPRVGQARR